MKYVIAVLLSALLVLLTAPKAPALTNSTVHNDSVAKPTKVTATKKVQSRPENKTLAKSRVGTKSKKKLATPPTKPKQQVVLTGCSSYRSDFQKYDWNVSVAEAICEAESNGNPNAISPINYDGLRDYGLMQLHGQPIFNPASNIAAAYVKYQSQGWEAWTTYNSGKYLSYL